MVLLTSQHPKNSYPWNSNYYLSYGSNQTDVEEPQDKDFKRFREHHTR
jgi:hypothetical protein